MSQFEENVKKELRNLVQKTENLSYVWKDPQYKEFEGYMTDLIYDLIQELQYIIAEKEELKYIYDHL